MTQVYERSNPNYGKNVKMLDWKIPRNWIRYWLLLESTFVKGAVLNEMEACAEMLNDPEPVSLYA